MMSRGRVMSEDSATLAAMDYLLRRVVSIVFIMGGMVMVIGGIATLLDPDATVMVNGSPERSVVFKLVLVLVPAVVAFVGVLLFRARPFFWDKRFPGEGPRGT
jgi:hypothetical protein